MRLMYTGKADMRVVSTADFPHIDFDLDEDVERIEWVWGEGQVLDVPDEVGEWLRTNHRNEFRIVEDPDESVEDEPELTEAEVEVVDDAPQPTADELRTELEGLTRDELVARAELKGLDFNTKTTKTEFVDMLVEYYHGDESANDDPIDPDSEPDSP